MEVVKRLYKEYYNYVINNNLLEVPEKIEYREFGYGYLKKVDNRNLSFKNEKEYKMWVLSNTPFHLYKSLAYCYYPNRQGGAKQKEVFRRELAFDIDVHKTEKCKHDNDFICKYCLEKAKKQALYLIDEFLLTDFGLKEDDILIVFSGNRGFHIYIKPKDLKLRDIIEQYSKEERRFLLSYVLGEHLNPSYIGYGWRRRLFKLLKPKDKKLLYRKNWKGFFNKDVILKNRLELDEKVMEDDIRLLRVIYSLHGYTGFIVKPVAYKDLKKFNPLKDAIFGKFEEKWYKVEINSDREFSITINNRRYTNRSKKVSGTALLFLFGHNIKFELL
ncbi:DNA primase, small subunit [Methanocaldococcus villosus KIN24-T80]|uniref:DNA primase small subunit PriS n=1 Tax=Methanocaldococcus villosus KIN24-T80 TaxID=1069083 RepID=N6UTM5_9EURY|nr:DNA primase catalytic subunit PriS [Methanocaldococcus villosus]ENN95684.1 DNA primase, small subunit [Methanocaldococcus villosus KIN24-T80]